MSDCTQYMITLGVFAGDDAAPTLLYGSIDATGPEWVLPLLDGLVASMLDSAREMYGRDIDPWYCFWSCSPHPDCR